MKRALAGEVAVHELDTPVGGGSELEPTPRGVLDEYKDARELQLLSAEARLIVVKSSAAWKQPQDAGPRWPFELLQNACDAGPREGRSAVSVEFSWEERDQDLDVIFQHDAAPFTMRDLAALLSGGSSKALESDQTTGRFGTGFLSTHVLSLRVDVTGLLQRESGILVEFDLPVDRSGDETQVLKNTGTCEEALTGASEIQSIGSRKSARFTYRAVNRLALELGLDALRESLAHLFLTCPRLGRVRIRRIDGDWETWEAQPECAHPTEEAHRRERLVTVRAEASDKVDEYVVLRFSRSPNARSGVQFVAEKQGGSLTVHRSASAPLLFRTFPIRGSHRMPAALAFDGPFEVEQERRTLILSEETLELLDEAVTTIPVAVRFAVHSQFGGSQHLASLRRPGEDFAQGEDRDRWEELFSSAARALVREPIVVCADGKFWPGDNSENDAYERYADFPAPRLLDTGESPELPVMRVWRLMTGTTYYDPPARELVSDWTDIVAGWRTLGVELDQRTLRDIREHVSEEVTAWDELRDVSHPRTWLREFIDAVGECWEGRGVVASVLEGLLPDQHSKLSQRPLRELRRDPGLSDELKDIAFDLGIDVRSRLLHRDLVQESPGEFRFLKSTIETLVPLELTEDELLDECQQVLVKRSSEDRALSAADRALFAASVRLIKIIGDRGGAALDRLREFPFLTTADSIGRSAPAARLMAPSSTWPVAARDFVSAYPASRVLADLYKEDSVITALSKASAIWREPLLRDLRVTDLKPERVEPLGGASTSVSRLALKDVTFSHVALLDSSLLSLAQDADSARALFGLILTYVAPADEAWTKSIPVPGRSPSDASGELRPALWLGDLLSRRWVPFEETQVRPSRESLRPLLKAEWLKDNEAAIRLLTDFFGFDALELRLLGIESSKTRQAVRNELARLLELAGSDVSMLARVAEGIEQRRAQESRISNLRAFGLAVQGVVQQVLMDAGLSVDVVDHGFDFSIEEDLADITVGTFGIGPIMMEVKATTQSEVRMTPVQAQTASMPENAHRYVLCVVQLPSDEIHSLDDPQRRQIVAETARIVCDIGVRAAPTTDLVSRAVAQEISIRNDGYLRYGVRADLWESGPLLAEWILTMFGRGAPASA